MIREPIELRPCIPSDVDAAVPLIYSSGPTAFDYVFKTGSRTAQEFLKHAFQRKGGEFSFDNHHAILTNNQLIGVGSAFSANKARTFMFKDFLNIVRFYKFGAPSVLIRGLKIEQVLKLPTKNEICLAHLGVREDKRSMGFGQKLIQYLMAEEKKNASNYFVLDVAEENPKAKKLYERMGFKVDKMVKGGLKTKFGYVPNFFRMHLPG